MTATLAVLRTAEVMAPADFLGWFGDARREPGLRPFGATRVPRE